MVVAGLERNPDTRQERLKKTIESNRTTKPQDGLAQKSYAHSVLSRCLPNHAQTLSLARTFLWAVVGAVSVFAVTVASAAAETRTLDLYNTHTKERLTITFKKDGRFIPSALSQLNQYLRDWRRNEAIKMDPRLFDTVWELHRQSGSRQPIHVVGGYRSLATNNMLRSRSRGVAKESQHTRGKAMDLFIPDVSVNRLREIGIKMQSGGVGWYPSANSPFVHIDVGSVRAWPRMTRTQLVKLFPDGKTVHLPADGKPLAGYQEALAEVKRNGGARAVSMASSSEAGSTRKGGGLLAMWFGGDEEDASEELSASAADGARAQAAETQPAAPEPAKKEPPAAEPVLAMTAPPPAPESGTVTSLADATLPGVGSKEAVPTQVASLTPPPPPRAKPDELVALPPDPVLVAAIVPRSRPDVPANRMVASLDQEMRPSQPTVDTSSDMRSPGSGEPIDARMALAEVANDPQSARSTGAILSYASASSSLPGETARRPALARTPQTVQLAGMRGNGSGQADPFASLPPFPELKSNMLATLSTALPVADLPLLDAEQSVYGVVFARFTHPNQRLLDSLLVAPVRPIADGFTVATSSELTLTGFTSGTISRISASAAVGENKFAMR